MAYGTRHIAGNIEAISWTSGFISGTMFFKHKTICNITQNIVAPSDPSPVSWKGKYTIVKSKHSSVFNVFWHSDKPWSLSFWRQCHVTLPQQDLSQRAVSFRNTLYPMKALHQGQSQVMNWTQSDHHTSGRTVGKKCRRAACELHWHVNMTLRGVFFCSL